MAGSKDEVGERGETCVEPGRHAFVDVVMPETALNEPVHLKTHPDEPVRSLDAAAKVIRRHAHGELDAKAKAVLRRMADASSPKAIAEAGEAFRAWAKAEGLLL